MANAAGLPEIAPGAAPGGFQTVQASPDAFGASAARGLQVAGQGLQAASDNIFKASQVYDQVAADDAANQYQERVGKLLYGDPAAPSQNVGMTGPVQNTGYLGLKGREALDARPELDKQISALQKEISGNLKNPIQQKLFTDFAGKYRTQQTARISTHATEQEATWTVGVNKAAEGLALTSIAQNPENPVEILNATEDLKRARVQNLQVQGLANSPEAVSQALATAKSDVLKVQTEAIAVSNPQRALEILEKNRDIAGVSYDELATKFRARAFTQQGREAADLAITGALAMPAAPIPPPTEGGIPATPAQINAAILQQESNANPNAPPSIDGAIGPGQIMPDTFRRYALSGETIGNPLDNQAVSRRITDAYYQKYSGDADRVAVAYFSGEGNVAPPGSPTPWKTDAKDGNGKSVSSYVADMQGRMAGTAPPVALEARIAQSKAAAVQAIVGNKTLPPEARTAALAQIDQTFRAQQIAAEQDVSARRLANEQAADGFTKRILQPGGVQPSILEEIRLAPDLTSETRRTLTEAAQKKSKDDVDKLTADYGAGFWDVYKKITAAPGDPNRITDVTELFRRAGPGGDLNLAGVEKLRGTMTELAKPETAAITAMKQGALAYAKSQLSFEFEMGNIKLADPQGMDDFNVKFIPAFYGQLEAGLQAGKTPTQLLSKESPDFIVDKLVSTYKRPEATLMRDRLMAGMNEGGKKPGTVKPIDTSTPEGLKKAVGAGQMDRSAAARLAIERGWVRAAAVPEAVTQPPVR